jgi:hypothetical protein
MVNLDFSLADRYVRDELGRAMPLKVKRAAPAHLKIAATRAYLPAWQEHQTIDVNQRIRGSVAHVDLSPPSESVLDDHYTQNTTAAPLRSPMDCLFDQR